MKERSMFTTMSLRRFPAQLLRLRWTYGYTLLIPFMNWLAEQPLPAWHFADGGNFNPLSLVVGVILVVRDFVQREIGHWVFIPLIVAAALTYFMVSPILAAASTVAFVIGELVDWAVFTITKRPLSERVLISAAFSVPADTLVFLYGWEKLNPGVLHTTTFLAMIASKMVAAYIVWVWLRRRERTV
jgi:queuosine precursor transporter